MGRRRLIPEDQALVLWDLNSSGVTMASLSRATGFGVTVISDAILRAGGEIHYWGQRRYFRSVDSSTKDEICRRVLEGESVASVAASFGKYRYFVSRILFERGIEIPKKGIRTKINDILGMRRAGNTYGDVGRKFGVTQERIRQLIAQSAPELMGTEVSKTAARQHKREAQFAKREKNLVDFLCPCCGKTIRVSKTKALKIKTCGRGCDALWREGWTWEKIREYVLGVLKMREEGKKWAEIAYIVNKHPQENLITQIKRFAEKLGIDVSWAFRKDFCMRKDAPKAPEGWWDQYEG